MAERVGKSRVAVANTLRLLRLPEPVKAQLTNGELSEGHARALLGLPDDESIVETAAVVVRRGLTVRQTEDLVRKLTEVKPEEERDEGDDPDSGAHAAPGRGFPRARWGRRWR